MFVACTVVLVFPFVFCLLSLMYFSCHVHKLTEADTKGDRSDRGVYQMRDLLCTKVGAFIVPSTFVNKGCTLCTTLFFVYT